MKKLIVLIALIVTPMVTNAQSFFDKLEDMDGVSSVIVSKDAFEILKNFKPQGNGSEAMEVFEMINDLKELKIFSTDKSAIADKMDAMVRSAVKSSKLTELMRIKEDDSRVKIYVKTGGKKDYVSEVLMFVKGIDKKTKGNVESVIISLTGLIDINKLSKIADTFTKENGVKVKVSSN